MLARCAVLLGLMATAQAEIEGFIVGGNYASIDRYPHSAFLSVHCVSAKNEITNWICGSSILTHRFVLTAGHCLHSCRSGTHIGINAENEIRYKGVSRSAHSFIVHEEYSVKSNANDIGLVQVEKPLRLHSKASRVALLKKPPYTEAAAVAGWGMVDEIRDISSYNLKSVDQNVWTRENCLRLVGNIPLGTICASNSDASNYAAQGDSGSALVVRGYIQIGLVSFKIPAVANNVIIYTDTGYFYDWIKFNLQRLSCDG